MGVHGSHCCKKHGCKYGNDDCPVVLGTEQQEHKQECCHEADFETVRMLNKIIQYLVQNNKTVITIDELIQARDGLDKIRSKTTYFDDEVERIRNDPDYHWPGSDF